MKRKWSNPLLPKWVNELLCKSTFARFLDVICLDVLTTMEKRVIFAPTVLATLPVRSASQGESCFFMVFLIKS